MWMIWKYKWIIDFYLLHIGVLVSMSQTQTFGSSSPPAEATNRSFGEIPTAATDARCNKCWPTALNVAVSQIITCTYKIEISLDKTPSVPEKLSSRSYPVDYRVLLTFDPIRCVSPVAKYFPELLKAKQPIGWVCPVRNSCPPPAATCRTVMLDPKG